MARLHGRQAEMMSNHTLGSTLVPALACESVPALGLEGSLRAFVAEVSDNIAKQLTPIAEHVQANQVTMDKLQVSISRLSKQVEERRATTCFESLPVLRHWESAMDKLEAHLKAAECNEQMSMANLKRLNTVISSATSMQELSKGTRSATEASLEQLQESDIHVHQRPSADRPRREPSPPTTPATHYSHDSAVREMRTLNTRKTLAGRNTENNILEGKQNTMLAVIREEFADLEKAAESGWTRRCFHNMGELAEWWLMYERQRTGPFASIVDGAPFECFFGLVIMADAVTITFAANYQMSHLEGLSSQLITRLVFWAFYCIELAMRLSVHRWHFFVGENCGWHNFDAVLVVALLYTNVTTLFIDFNSNASSPIVQSLRMLKLVRVFKVLRLIHFFRLLTVLADLQGKVKFLLGSLPNTIGSVLMLLFVLYVFGLIMVQELSAGFFEQDDCDPVMLAEVRSFFGSVAIAMFTLFRSAFNGDNWDRYYQIVAQRSSFTAAIFVFFVLFIQVTLLNIFTANFVLCAETLAKPDDHTKAMEETLKQRKQAEQIRQLCTKIDHNGSQTISREEFNQSLESVHMRALFVLCGLDIPEDFFDVLLALSNDNEVQIDTFVDACMQMKGTATAIGQQKLLMEARDFHHKVANHFLRIKFWQQDVNQKLDELSGR